MKTLNSLFLSALLAGGLASPTFALNHVLSGSSGSVSASVSVGGTSASVSVGGGSASASASTGSSGSGGSHGGDNSGGSNSGGGSSSGGSDSSSTSDSSDRDNSTVARSNSNRSNFTAPASRGQAVQVVGTSVWTLDNVLIGVVTSQRPSDRNGMIIVNVQTADEFGLPQDRVQLMIQETAFRNNQLRLSQSRNQLIQLLG